MVVDPADADGWLTLATAAAQLEISLDAVRRRMRRGDFPRRQVRSRHGLTWQIRLDDNGADPGATLAHTVVPTVDVEPTVQALLAYLRDRDQQRDAEVAQLRADLAHARADLVDHATQLAEARQELRALQAPAFINGLEIALGRDSEHATAGPAKESSATRSGGPWWRRWLAPYIQAK